MRDDALAWFKALMYCSTSSLFMTRRSAVSACLGRIERAGRVAVGIAFGKRELEDGPQIPAQMRHDAAGERFRFADQERLQSLEAQVRKLLLAELFFQVMA